MTRLRTLSIVTGLVLGSAVAVPSASAAFELFGFRLWGSAPEEDKIEIIDPLPYTVTLRVSGGGDNKLQKRMETASALWSDRETPASGNAGLISKARGDYRRLLATLYTEGFYGPYISIRINGVEASDLTLAAELPPDVPVTIEIDPGPPFLFGTTRITNAPPFQPEGRDGVDTPKSVGFETGKPARSGAITAASALAVEQWRQLAYAKAQETNRDVIADHSVSRLDVDVTIDPGRKARYGTISVDGETRVDREFIAYMANLPEGGEFDPDEVRGAEDRLSSLGVFRSLRIVEDDNILEDGSLPMTIVVEDRRRRTIGFGGTYSTIDGVGIQAYWVHRNLFGKAERLRFEAGVEGVLLTADPTGFNYNLGVTFTKPGVLSPDNSFVASLIAQRLDYDTYRQTSITARAGLSRRFGEFLTGDVFGEVQKARFLDDFGTRDFLTFAVVGRGQYDRRNDPLDATSGYFLAAEMRPFYEAEFGNPALRGTVEGRGYLGFTEEDRFVLAGRAKFGGFGGPPVEESPPDMLFFAGGGGSVRGYAFNSIGVDTTDAEGETGVVGGRGLIEGSGELRARFTEKYGGVAFVDVGLVAPGITPDSADDVRVGVGLGLRYFTGIGPAARRCRHADRPASAGFGRRGLFRDRTGVLKRLAILFGVLFLAAIAALAQGPDDEDQTSDNGFLLNLLENQLSAPGRQISLRGVTGALSSQAGIEQITISDARGPWLQIDNVVLDWNRAQLLLGRVNVNLLSAERIAWLRKAEPPKKPAIDLDAAEAKPFALPELPVSIDLKELRLDSVVLDQQVFGTAAELSAGGKLTLAGGALDTAFDIVRKDAPGGELALSAAFSNETREVALDLHLSEPDGGLISTLLRIEGAPAIDLRVAGSGPLDNVDFDVALDAAGKRLAGGQIALRGTDDGLGFDADLRGGLTPLIPVEFRDFFAGETSVQLRGLSKTGGGLRIDNLGLSGAVLDLTGRAETGADGFLRSLDLSGTLGDPAAPAVRLPIPGQETRLNSAILRVNYGDASNWSGLLVLDRLSSGGIEMEDVTLDMGGHARNLEDPALRDVTVVLEGLATGVWAEDPKVRAALGTRLDLFADAALKPGGAIELRQVQLGGNGLSVFTAGTFEDLVYTGRSALNVADIAILSGLAGRELSGAVAMRAVGSVTPLSGGFDLDLDGTADDLALGDPRLDRVMAGRTTMSGRAIRDATGFRTESLRLENPQLSFVSDGQVSPRATDFGFDARLADLALIDPRAEGALTASGRARGQGAAIGITLDTAVQRGSLLGRKISGLELGFEGRLDGSDVSGRLTGDGQLDSLVLDLGADVSVVGDSRSVSGLRLAVGANVLTGDIAQTAGAPVTGKLSLRAPDVASLAAMALVEAAGSLSADVVLDAGEIGQAIAVTAEADDLAMGANRIGAMQVDASITDAFGLPFVSGTLDGSDIAVAGLEIASASAKAEQTGADRMRITAESRLAIGTLIDAGAELARLPDGFAVTLESLRLRQAERSAQLAAPATVTIAGGAVTLTPLELDFGTGSLSAEGHVAEDIDIRLDIADLPLDLGNAIRPQLELAGVVNGTARVGGTRAAPSVTFDASATGLATAPTRAAGVPPIDLTASGRTEGDSLDLDASVAAAGGLSAQATGSHPARRRRSRPRHRPEFLPAVAGRRRRRQTRSCRQRHRERTGDGSAADPSATFDINGSGIGATILRDNAVPPMTVALSGAYSGGAITLSTARLGGAPGLDISGSGRIPLTGPGLDVSASGTVPVSLANPILEARSAQATGTLRVDATARGSLAAPQLGGNVSLSGGTIVEPQLNIRLEDISLDAGLEGDTVVLRSFRAAVRGGGEITSSGRLSLDAARGFPADVTTRMNDVRYTDGAFVATRFSGELTVSGPLQGGGGTLSGRIDLGKTEISISEGLGLNAQAKLEQVRHLRPPPRVVVTLERAKVGEPQPPQPTGRSGLMLDVLVSAAEPDLRSRARARCRARRRTAAARTDHGHPAGGRVHHASRAHRRPRPADRFRGRVADAGRRSRPAHQFRRPDAVGRRHRGRDRFRARLGTRDQVHLRAAAARGRSAVAAPVQARLAGSLGLPGRAARGGGGRARRRRRQRPAGDRCAARQASTTSTSSPRNPARPRCAPANTSATTSISTCRPPATASPRRRSCSKSTTWSPPEARSGPTATRRSAIFYERDF